VKQLEDLLRNHSDVHPDAINVTFDQFQDNGFNVSLNFFTSTTVLGEFLRIKEEINFAIMEILEKEDVSLAIPSTRLYVDNGDDFQLEKGMLGRREA
jgi:MscS family membrane protein